MRPSRHQSRYTPRHARRRSRDKAASQDRLGIVLLGACALVVALVGVGFAATYHPSDIDKATGCPAGNRAPVAHTIILVDETDQLSPDQLRDAKSLIQTEYMWLPIGGRLTVRSIVADPGAATDIAVVCRIDDGSHANIATQNAHQMKWAFERTVGSKLDALYASLANAPVQDASPIMESASATMDRPDFGPNVISRRLIILSDFAQHSGLVSQYGHGLDLSHQARAQLRRDMDGVDVRLHYIPRPKLANLQGEAHEAFWTGYFRDMGAHVALGTNLLIGEDPSKDTWIG